VVLKIALRDFCGNFRKKARKPPLMQLDSRRSVEGSRRKQQRGAEQQREHRGDGKKHFDVCYLR
jgi:hypothetical protein